MRRKIIAVLATFAFGLVLYSPRGAEASDDCGGSGERWTCQGDALCNGGTISTAAFGPSRDEAAINVAQQLKTWCRSMTKPPQKMRFSLEAIRCHAIN